MGEIAEMMLEGDLCEGCGEYLGDGDGFPRRCEGCERNVEPYRQHGPKTRNVGCPNCNKKFATHEAYLDHYRAKHDKTEGKSS